MTPAAGERSPWWPLAVVLAEIAERLERQRLIAAPHDLPDEAA